MKPDDEVQANLRIPKPLKDKLKAAAKENHRSMTAEVVARLESTFEEDSLYGQPLGSAASTLAGLDLDELLQTVGGAINSLLSANEALYIAIRHAQRVERAQDKAAEQRQKDRGEGKDS